MIKKIVYPILAIFLVSASLLFSPLFNKSWSQSSGPKSLNILGAAITVNAGNNGINTDTTLKAATTNLRLMGVSIRESSAGGGAATVILRHGVVSGTCTGNEIAYIELLDDQSLQIQYAIRGLAVPSGVCASVVAGTVDVSIQTVVEAAP